jgi:hypothetical protein
MREKILQIVTEGTYFCWSPSVITAMILEVVKTKQRSKQENSYYWAVIVLYCSNFFGYTREEMHDALKYKFLRVVSPGKPDIFRSTASLTTVEAEEYYANIRMWMVSEYGVIIPTPNENIC